MEGKIRLNLEKLNLGEKEKLLLAVSGGPDSMAMLFAMKNISETMGFKLFIAHVNHGVRGELALRDQVFVEKTAKELNIPYYTKNVDMVAYGKELGISSEDAGRLLRYGFFREVLSNLGGGYICVAHNKNDQAETVLLRILRGTGVEGLKAMELISGDIIRPLINVERTEIEDYIRDNKIETMLDHTNLQAIYSRNKVRLELIPYIQENFNPNIIDSLCRLSEIASWEMEIINKVVEKKFNLLVKNISSNSIIFKGDEFLSEDDSIKRKLIRRGIHHILGHLNGIQEVNVGTVLDLFNNGITGKAIHLPNNLMARISYNDYVIKTRKEEAKDPNIYKLHMGVNRIEKLNMIVEISNVGEKDINFSDKSIKYFNKDMIHGDISIRFRADGDRFVPFGGRGTKKIKDYFIDKKIPKDKRDMTPIIVDEEKILWIVGLSIDDRVRVIDQCNVLKIEVKELK